MRVMSTPKGVDLAITDRCNLRCKYCAYYSSACEVGEDLSTETWLSFFEELKECAVMNVCLQGGEPFCRPDLKELIEGIVRGRMRFSILTNGTLVTDEMAEFLANTGRCDSVQVSIDGSVSEVHDSMCGEGSFERAVAGLKSLQKHRIPVTVRVTIHKKNVADLENIAKFLLEDLGLSGFGTNSAGYMGLCRQHSENIQLDAEDRSVAMEKLLRLNQKYNNRINAMAGPLAEARGWSAMVKARRENKELSGRGKLVGCGGMFSKLAVRADGVFIPCIQLGHIELGKMNQDSLRDVWQNHPALQKLRERREIKLSEFEFCKDCDYINYCTGNCPGIAFAVLDKVDHPSPDACLKQFLEEGGRLPDEKLLGDCGGQC